MRIQNRARYFLLVGPGPGGSGDQVVRVRKDTLETRSNDGSPDSDAGVMQVVEALRSAKSAHQAALPYRLGDVLADCVDYYGVCESEDARQIIRDLVLDAYKNIRKIDARGPTAPTT